jgi:hypothetical protein
MGMSYSHLLIPGRAAYAPRPGQIADFFAALIEIGAAPENPKLWAWADFESPTYAKRKGWKKFQTLRVGELTAVTYTATFKDVAGLREALHALQDLDEYNVSMFGSGPSKLSLFPAYTFVDGKRVPYDGPWHLEARCRLEPDIVSTSRNCSPAPLGNPCNPTQRTGSFRNPETGEAIRVPNAGRARFWIEFNLGKWLFPEIKDNNLDLLPASIVQAAQKAFAVRFAQGCDHG